MARDLDAILRQMPAPDPDALARARARLQAELALKKRPIGWRREVLGLFAASAGLAVAVAAVGVALGGFDAATLGRRLAGFALLALAGGAGAYASLKPGARASRWVALGLAIVAAGAVLAARVGAQPAPSLPEWVCSVGHISMGAIPITVAMFVLRRTAYSTLRAVVAGVGAGTLGAMMGELACSRGVEHVVIHHLTAWAVVTALTVVLASRIRRRAFAP